MFKDFLVFKTLRVKYKTVIVSVFIISCFSTFVVAQIDTTRITYKNKKSDFQAFFNSIASNSGIRFFYKHKWFDNDTVNQSFTNIPLKKALSIILSGKPYTYELIDDNIIFLPKADAETIYDNIRITETINRDVNTIVIGKSDNSRRHEHAILSGFVLDGKNGAPLIGASIILENTTIGTVTDYDGHYRLQLKPGLYTINYSSIGYEKTKKKIKLIGNGKLNIKLFEESVELNEIAVYSRKVDRNVSQNQMSVIEMDKKALKQMPVITGEKDVLKGITTMPGVKSIGEFGSGINVRGGGEDQNLYLLEGTPLFNTSHVFGLISVINPDAVENVTLYKGHIPPGYGERVSSVMQISLQNNHVESLKAQGGIGIYNSRLLIESPVIDKILSFRIGGRSSYSNWLLKQFNDYYLQNSSAAFHDLFGTINLSLKKDRMSFTGYRSKDQFNYASTIAYGYGNTIGSFKWSHIFGEGLSSSLTTSYSNYLVNKDLINHEIYKKRINSGIQYLSSKANLSYNYIPGHQFDAGFKAIQYSINPGSQTPLNKSLIKEKMLDKEQAMEYACYINDLYNINDFISINAGLRYSFYHYLGPHSVYTYEKNMPKSKHSITDTTFFKRNKIIQKYKGIEPRLSLKIQFSKKNSIKLSYNRNLQYISLLSHTSISTPDDNWKLSDPYLQPIICGQLAAGYYHNFFNNKLETSLEIYYKDLKNMKEYKNNASLNMNPHIETDILNAKGQNYGVECLIRKNFGKFDGWISYTWSRSFVKTSGKTFEESINNNEFYPSSFDKPHDLSVVASYHFNRRVRISGNFSYATGRPVTLPEYEYPLAGNTIIFYSDRNKHRVPPYHRLDISLTIDESLKKNKPWKGRWTFSLLNVYGRKNPYSIFYKKEDPTYVNNYKTFSLYKMYLIGKPFPTVSYSFIFKNKQ
jgi:hypothetical protein